MRLYILTVAASALLTGFLHQAAWSGYGDVAGGLPLMKERQVLVLANACRMAPEAYRDTYVGAYPILDSSKYPAVDPLYWNGQLNTSAHDHAVDMGDTCGILQHNSCNGTTWDARIRAYYAASFSIGENIAAGNADPFATMNQWIMDNPQGSTQPAADFSWCRVSGSADSTRCDGHRANIMNGQYKEMGTGYAYGSSAAARYHPFWVQDFGGGKPGFTNPIVAAAHFLRQSATTTFLVDYFDPLSKPPSEGSLFLDGQKTALSLAMGKPWRGTYQVALPRGNACRMYYVIFIDGNGTSWRYPEGGALVTTGEGPCTREYLPPESLSVVANQGADQTTRHAIVTRVHSGIVEMTIPSGMNSPSNTSIIDCKGNIVLVHRWISSRIQSGGHRYVERFLLPQKIIPGIYFFLHYADRTRAFVEKIGIVG